MRWIILASMLALALACGDEDSASSCNPRHENHKHCGDRGWVFVPDCDGKIYLRCVLGP
jgi:hypothetical protein